MASAPLPGLDDRPILSIDTSSSQGGIALYDGRTLSTRSWPAERSHTTTLLSEIHHLLDRAEVRVPELAAVAIAIGPGAFTGLRVGFGVAKGFHLATKVPLIGISTLEATALGYATCRSPSSRSSAPAEVAWCGLDTKPAVAVSINRVHHATGR